VDQPAAVPGFLAKYDAAIAAQAQCVRDHLAGWFPKGFELIYDNYNALVFGISPTERASDVVVSVAAYPKWVTLFFMKGADLPDPSGVLQGSGTRVRSVRLVPADVLHSAAVQGLLRLAAESAPEAFSRAPPLAAVVKSVSARQRPRKPTPTRSDAKASRARRGSGAAPAVRGKAQR